MERSWTAPSRSFIAGILGGGPDAAERAHKLATLTAGLSRDEIKKLIAPGAGEEKAATKPDAAERTRQEADRLIARRKREILERECFGLIEIVEPAHGFDVVGGMDEVKKDLMVIADNIKNARTARVPMGLLFTGPMGTGKTFVAEAFAKECGLTTIKLKNFRSKWVGATEGNLERILTVIKAIGQVVVIKRWRSMRTRANYNAVSLMLRRAPEDEHPPVAVDRGRIARDALGGHQ